jgi:Diacylglycerol acyltransferase
MHTIVTLYSTQVLSVRGRPLGIPAIAEPTHEQVLEWHAKYVAEVKRLFDKYKEKAGPDYAHKSLILDVDV